MLGEIAASCVNPANLDCAVDAEDGLARTQLQHPGFILIRRSRDKLTPLNIAADANPFRVTDIAEANGAFAGGLVDDEGPTALPPPNKPLALHLVEGFAHGPDTDAELARKLNLVWNCSAWLPCRADNSLNQHVLYLQVEGAS
jgi:hypothetical protein